MIPRVISRQHLLQAIQQASRHGVPRGRHSRDYCLAHKSGHYPPKYIIALAHNIARDRLLRCDEFNGGRESNDFLRSRGFTVVGCTCGGTGPNTRSMAQGAATSGSRTTTRPLPTHSERCPECKVRIGQMLERIYGTCLRNHRFQWSAQLSDYRATPIFSTLKPVLDSLEAHKGHRNFVKARRIDPCDFFVPKPGFVVEVDESQHFTVPRRLALSHYPPDFKVGFSVECWISLCDKHNAKDNNPPYRDEQRAWYDTLRDLVPALHGYRPTVRLYAAEAQWCTLDPDDAKDVSDFRKCLAEPRVPRSHISIGTAKGRDRRHPRGQQVESLSSAVATVLTEEWGHISDPERDGLMQGIVARVMAVTERPVVIVFPAGYYRSSGTAALFRRIGTRVADMLSAVDPDGRICVCLGVDGLDSQQRAADQLVMAVSSHGPEAAGKKFYPTSYEKAFVNLSKPDRGEFGHKRVLSWPRGNGSDYYLAACYDGYGIANGVPGTHKQADAILEFIHGFSAPGTKGSGVGYYPRGLARASQNWACPVFSGAAFRDRGLSCGFPSGLLVKGWTRGWNEWTYEDNLMAPPRHSFTVTQSAEIKALVQIWS